jgi:hypothetical protein
MYLSVRLCQPARLPKKLQERRDEGLLGADSLCTDYSNASVNFAMPVGLRPHATVRAHQVTIKVGIGLKNTLIVVLHRRSGIGQGLCGVTA